MSTPASAATQSSSSMPVANPRRSARKYASAATSWRRMSGSMPVEAVIADGADSRTTIAALSVRSDAPLAAFRLVVFFTGDTRFVTITPPSCVSTVGIAGWAWMAHPASLQLYNGLPHIPQLNLEGDLPRRANALHRCTHCSFSERMPLGQLM